MRKKIKTILLGMLSFACLCGVGSGLSQEKVSANNFITNDYESVSTEFRQPDATKVTASTGSYASESTTNVGLGYAFSGNGSTFELPGTYNFNDLTANMGELIKLQVNPKNEGEVAVSLLEMKFIDSENPYRYLDVVVTCNDIYNAAYGLTWNTSALVTLVDSQTFFRKGNYNVSSSTARLFLNDAATMNGISNTYNNGSYHALGATIGEHSTMYPIMAKKAGENTSAISVTYDNYVIKVNGVKVVNLLDSAFLNGATLTNQPYYVNEGNKDERISARYTESYVKGLFASGKVKVQLKVNCEQPRSVRQSASLTNTEVDGSGTINVINLFGYKTSVQSDASLPFIGELDTVKPTILTPSAFDETKNCFSFDGLREIEVSDLQAMFSATDDMDNAPVVSMEIYNKDDEKYTLSQTHRFAVGDYIKVSATDFGGNVAERVFATDIWTIDVSKPFQVELSTQSVTYVVLSNMPGGYTYSAKLYEKTDTNYQNPLSQTTEYTFSGLGEYKIAIIVYYEDLQSVTIYADLQVVDGKAPIMEFAQQYEESYSVNECVEIIMPTVTDNDATGETQLTVSASFAGEEVEIKNNSLTLTNIGEYLVTYTCVDASGNVAVETFVLVNLGEDFIKPVIQIQEEYAKTYNVGDTVSIIQPTISDNSALAPTLTIEIVQNGKILEMQDNKIVLQEAGEVFVLYTVVDQAGNVNSEMRSFEVVGTEAQDGASVLLIVLLSVGGVILVGGIILTVVLLKKKKSEVKQNEKQE